MCKKPVIVLGSRGWGLGARDPDSYLVPSPQPLTPSSSTMHPSQRFASGHDGGLGGVEFLQTPQDYVLGGVVVSQGGCRVE